MKVQLALCLGLGATCSVFSQAVITDGTSSFGWTSASALSGAANRTGTAGGTSSVFTTNGSVNQSFQEWWWYHVSATVNREFALSNQSAAPVVNGNTMTLSYQEIEGFSSTLTYTINNSNLDTVVTGTNRIKNTSSTALSFSFFNYVDWDINGTGASDNAVLTSNRPNFGMRVFETGSQVYGNYRSLDNTGYAVAGFSSIRNELTDGNLDGFFDTGLPFSSGDFTSVVRWEFSLNPGHEIMLQTTRTMSTVPEPGTMAALALGGLALLRRRRKA